VHSGRELKREFQARELSAITKAEFSIRVPSLGVEAPQVRLRASADWQTQIDRLFEIRHEIVHNPNHRITLTQHEMKTLETTVLFFASSYGLVGRQP
jgi:hypothetical protein